MSLSIHQTTYRADVLTPLEKNPISEHRGNFNLEYFYYNAATQQKRNIKFQPN